MSTSEPTLLEELQPYIGSAFGEYSPSAVGRSTNPTLIAADESGVALAFEVREEMTNPVGTLHGGWMSVMLDETIGMSTFVTSNGRFFATVNLAVDFLSSAKVGEVVTVRATIQRRGRRVINVQGEITDAKGTLVARATSNLIAVD